MGFPTKPRNGDVYLKKTRWEVFICRDKASGAVRAEFHTAGTRGQRFISVKVHGVCKVIKPR